MSKVHPKTKPTLTIIGPGRLGIALALALSERGYSIKSLVGRSRSRLKKAAALLDGQVRLVVAKEIQQLTYTDLTIITTPDDQLASVAKALCRVKTEAGTALHSSGAFSSEVLSPLADRGWRTGSIHPLVSVSDSLAGAKSFEGAFWCVEGDGDAVKAGRSLIRDLQGRSFSISTTVKPLYHAAAVMTSGNVVALFDVAIDMLSQCGLNRNEARRVLLPLLESTVANLRTRMPAKAMTGTFSRGDVATVKQHLRALTGKDLREARALYSLLGLKALKLAEENHLDQKVSRRIANMLKE